MIMNKLFHNELRRIGKLPTSKLVNEKFNCHSVQVGEKATKKQLSQLLARYRGK